jgi:uncharacterized protein (DUF608 family)
MNKFVYNGVKTREISFPLGGIGTGCIGLAGNGRLIDWEIFNKPNKGSVNGFSHFAIKAEQNGKVLDARVLNGDLHPPYSGQGTDNFAGFGFGVRREYLTGLPHFDKVEFRGEFPIAELSFKSRDFPGDVRMVAFNPLIPLNDKDSGIPAAFFEFEIQNNTKAKILYTLAGTLCNPLPKANKNAAKRAGNVRFIHFSSDAKKENEVGYGDMCLATDACDISWQEYWYRGNWFDSLEVFWRDFTSLGPIKSRIYSSSKPGEKDNGTLAIHVEIGPGKTERVRFVTTWNFPNCENYWSKTTCECAKKAGASTVWKNYYATTWKDSKDSALYCIDNWNRLFLETSLFKNTLFSSDLPAAAIDAVSANISILKSPTVLRLEDGTLYGWEGCNAMAGCCEGSCTHVWNYAQVLPFLFPKLERSMREADYKFNLRDDGGMPFRLIIPTGITRSDFRPCADGQMGGILKAYCDWKICGDDKWLAKLWPAIKKSLEFAWSDKNEDKWDPDKSGVLTGRQHHTLDMEMFGPNSWLTGIYLGALKAAAEMAEHLGQKESAAEYRQIFEKGKAWADKHLFNGEYYFHKINLDDKGILEKCESGSRSMMGKAIEAYWDKEHGEIKYQIGEGCGIDQVLGQWHANLYGLGEIFDKRQTKKALRSIFRNNFKKPMRDHWNPCRIYCLNDEGGLVICDWPEGKRRPVIPAPYCEETMHGFEYAAAAHMIQEGLVNEGMIVVESLRERYDGERRNPWNEIECGSNYARSMASYSLLNSFSGFRFDMVKGMIGFNPVGTKKGSFRCFWSLDSGWGEFVMDGKRAELTVLYGSLKLNALDLPFLSEHKVKRVTVGNKRVAFTARKGMLSFMGPVVIKRGETIKTW